MHSSSSISHGCDWFWWEYAKSYGHFQSIVIYGWVFKHFVSHLFEVFKLHQVHRQRFTSIMSLSLGKYGLHTCRCNWWHYGWLLLLISESMNGQSLVSCPLLHVELRWSELACQMYSLQQWVFICHTSCKVCIMEKNVARAL